MSTKSHSPGPATPLSTPRRPRKIARDTATPDRKEGSAGGIILTPEQMEDNKTPPATNNKDSTTQPQRRRKPRKLNRDPPPSGQDAAAATTAKEAVPPASTDELEALKSRVRGLEAKVEELYKANANGSNRSPRRRGKGRKGSNQQVPTATGAPAPTEPSPEAEVEEIGGAEDAELRRLEGELEDARQDLAAYQPGSRRRQRGKARVPQEDDDIEEINRDGTGTESSADGRQVTLAGSYRIPLPASVDMKDIKSIQNGINSVQNVAKGYLEHRRAQQGTRSPQPRQPQRATSTPSPAATGQGQSWGEWFGAYSMQVSKAMKNIEAEAAIESTPKAAQGKRPIQGTRTASTPTGPAKGSTKRPANQARLSQQQVNTLMS